MSGFAQTLRTFNETGNGAWYTYFMGKVALNGDCILWTRSKHNLGYGTAGRTRGEVKAHRISWALAHGEIPKHLGVLHKCDVRACVNPDHLFLGTHLENMRDMVAKGRLVQAPPMYGTDNPQAVLTDDDVWAIKFGLTQIFTQREIAEGYGVSAMAVSRVVRNQTWQHITPSTLAS